MRLVATAAFAVAALLLTACGDGENGPRATPDDDFATVGPSEPDGAATDPDNGAAIPDPAEQPPSESPADPGSDPGDPGGEPGDPEGDPPGQPDPPVAEALQFTGQTVAGDAFDAASLAGQPTMFWFWAPWCTECAARAPDVRAAADDFGTDVQIVGVAGLSSDVDSMAAFVERHDLGDLTQLADADGSVYTRFGITQQDAFVLVAPDGAVSTVEAYGTDIDLRELIERELL